ncbi:MAG: 50S ribosomal protein L18, partial [Bacteroidota bacterium]
MKVLEEKIRRKLRRKKHIRKTITGTPERPRLAVFRSNKHFYAQIINDEEMKTIVSASSNDKDVRDKVKPE